VSDTSVLNCSSAMIEGDLESLKPGKPTRRPDKAPGAFHPPAVQTKFKVLNIRSI
jgi:hypothetical protein